MILWKAILAFLFAVSVARAETITFWLDPSLEDRQYEIWEGLGKWSKVCNVQFIRKMEESKARISIYRKDNIDLSGYRLGTFLYLNPSMPYLSNTTAHEVGHYLIGNEHSANPSDMMYHTINARQRISLAEAKKAITRFGELRQ